MLPLAAVLLVSPPALAQPAPAAAPDDDMEVPATAAPAAPTPSATVPAPAPPAALAASPEANTAAATAPTAAPTAAPAGAATRLQAGEGDVPKAEPSSLGGLRISGYLHAQYQHSAASEDQLNPSGAPLNENEFVLRRARLRFDRTWDYAAANLELDANTVRGMTVGIRRAEAAIFYRGPNAPHLPPLLGLAAGITDLPFGFELPESTRDRIFMERTLGSTALFPSEADAGAKLFGAYSVLRYAVAISNGEPLDRNGLPHDPNSAKDVTGRFGAEGEPARGFTLAGGTSFITGTGFHRGQAARKSVIRWRDDNEDGVLQANEIIATPGTAATPSKNFDRWVLGLDLETSLTTRLGRTMLYGEAFVASSYDRGYVPADPAASGVAVREAGGYVAFAQELTKYALVGLRASIYDPNSDVFEVHADKTVPKTQTVRTFSALGAAVLPGRARLSFQYDWIKDYLARDSLGVPSDARNNRWTLRLGVDL
ncbi:MAG: hypothetical protein ABUL60_31155 [Myxococcales bacterium]